MNYKSPKRSSRFGELTLIYYENKDNKHFVISCRLAKLAGARVSDEGFAL